MIGCFNPHTHTHTHTHIYTQTHTHSQTHTHTHANTRARPIRVLYFCPACKRYGINFHPSTKMYICFYFQLNQTSQFSPLLLHDTQKYHPCSCIALTNSLLPRGRLGRVRAVQDRSPICRSDGPACLWSPATAWQRSSWLRSRFGLWCAPRACCCSSWKGRATVSKEGQQHRYTLRLLLIWCTAVKKTMWKKKKYVTSEKFGLVASPEKNLK